MAGRQPDQDDLYRARQSVAKWLRRKFPWTLARRVPQPGAALDADRSPRSHGGLPLPIQPLPAAQQAGLPKPKTFRGHNPKRSISGSSRPRAPYAAAGRTKANNITKSQTTLLLTRNGGSTYHARNRHKFGIRVTSTPQPHT